MSQHKPEDTPNKIMSELDELVDFLADGPEAQQEMKLGQEELFSPKDAETAAEQDSVPVLTAAIGSETLLDEAALPKQAKVEINTEIDTLIDEVVDKLVPKLEAELRRRLKNIISGD